MKTKQKLEKKNMNKIKRPTRCNEDAEILNVSVAGDTREETQSARALSRRTGESEMEVKTMGRASAAWGPAL